MATTDFPSSVPSSSRPEWDSTVDFTNPGICSYGMVAATLISFARPPRPVPRMIATSGARLLCLRTASADCRMAVARAEVGDAGVIYLKPPQEYHEARATFFGEGGVPCGLSGRPLVARESTGCHHAGTGCPASQSATAETASESRRPARARNQPAQAIMAALSVHSGIEGMASPIRRSAVSR